MAPSIGNAFSTQLTSSSLRPFYGVKINFTSGTLLMATTYSDIVINGNTYIGSRNILQISNVLETFDTKATGMQITLNGLDTAILSAGLTEDTSGMICEIYFGVLTTTNNAEVIVDTPYQIFSGFIDTMVLSEDGESSVLIFTIENKLITLERPIDRRYTNQDQLNLFPGDKGCSFVTGLQNKTVAWGAGVIVPTKNP